MFNQPAFSSYFDFSKAGNIGSFIGGVVSPFLTFIMIILIYLTYTSQKKELNVTSTALQKQTEIAERQKFENNFFEMLKIHRDNVSQISYEDQTGRGAFIKFIEELTFIFETITDGVLKDYKVNSWGENLHKLQFYYVLFYVGAARGVGKNNENWKAIVNYLKINISDAEEELKYFLSKQKKYKNRIFKSNQKFRGKKLYGIQGQSNNLGHYFRHLYRTVRFVDDHPLFEEDKDMEKRKKYIKILRAQLSDYELAVFFLNSLTKMGNVWEFKWSDKNVDRNGISLKPNKKPKRQTVKLITEYNLLKKLPKNIISGLNHKDYYP